MTADAHHPSAELLLQPAIDPFDGGALAEELFKPNQFQDRDQLLLLLRQLAKLFS